jgi:hypothetical protein
MTVRRAIRRRFFLLAFSANAGSTHICDLCQPGPADDLFQQFRLDNELDAGDGGLATGSSRRAAIKTGMSCGWQFSTHAACSAVRRSGNCPGSRKK